MSVIDGVYSNLFDSAIAAQKVKDCADIDVFGYREGVAAGATVDVWNGATANRVDLTDNAIHSIVSTSAADTGIYNLFGLDKDYKTTANVVQLNGTTPVTQDVNGSSLNLMFVNKMIYVSGVVNVGSVSITEQTGLTQQGLIAPNQGVTQMTNFAVAEGRTLIIDHIYLDVRRNDDVVYQFAITPPGDISYIREQRYSIYQNSREISIKSFTADSRTRIKVIATLGTNNSDVNVGIYGRQVPTGMLTTVGNRVARIQG